MLLLSDEERDVLRWGRNCTVSPPKGVDSMVYKKATALEVLVRVLHRCKLKRVEWDALYVLVLVLQSGL